MGRQRHRGQPPGRERRQIPCAHLEQNLPGSRSAQLHQSPEAVQTWRSPAAEERMAAPAFIAPGKAQQRRCHEDARDDGRDSRALHAHRGHSEFAVDQHPVAEPVEQIGPDVGDGNDAHIAHPLQVAARPAIEQQRQRAPVENAQVSRGRSGDRRIDAEARKAEAGQEDHQHQRRRGECRPGKRPGPASDGIRRDPCARRPAPPACPGRAAVQCRRAHGVLQTALPRATAPMAAGPSLPTMMVSTMPSAIQPSSLKTTGTASATIAPNSCFHCEIEAPRAIPPLYRPAAGTANPAVDRRKRRTRRLCETIFQQRIGGEFRQAGQYHDRVVS